ncbi:arylsulfatase [Rhizobium leguminosarum]|jgi:arylsulfatase|uniref:arylsulfatase n=1 Tax=Rhizobium leguminosarum TaxID=384 RepID=UPI001C9168E8|nr:arylsulfatase [Rhizobium leguminosarum]MBY3043862.1 arylsulfatase [Rhizobium leguminosarum]
MSSKSNRQGYNATRRQILLAGGSAIALMAFCPIASIPALAQAGAKKPNILVIFGDDIGWWNTSAYNRGQMGYQTPNIDRIADEGAMFTDLYAQQSCTAGRAAFITGQSCFRTGLLKVGLPGAKEGLSEKDPTIAELLKPQGYVTGQFGKNHLGDRNEFLPTVHGFDEFFGNLYHLNAEEEPENPDYPKDPQFLAKFGPRGVLKCKASETDDPTEDPRFGRVGKQTIEDTGPLNRKRMETVDEEFLGAAKDFIDRSAKADKPFFCWFNSTRMHIYTHLKAESEGKTGLGIVADGMAEFDGMVGQLLDQLDDLGIAENTIVVWTTDNGAEVFSWPDGGTTPFHGEKNTNWEGGYRVPGMVRWPGVVKPGTEINEIVSHEDWLPTLVAAAGEPDIAAKLLNGYEAAGKTFNVHLDGYNQRKLLDGTGPGARKEYFYWTDDGSLAGLRYDRWKLVFMEQRAEGLDVWQDPLITLRFPKLIDLRADPFEIAQHAAGDYARWRVEHAFALVPAQAYVAKHLQTYVKYPPRQAPGSFSMDHVLEKLQRGGGQ